MNAWDRRPGEPSRWFDRFEHFRALGPQRSVDRAALVWSRGRAATAATAASGAVSAGTVTDVERSAKVGKSQRASRHWYAAAELWDWEARAAAYDDHLRDELRRAEEARRFDARQRRLAVVEALLDDVAGALAKVDLSQLTDEQVLGLLPQLRVYFKDLVQMERLEYGEASEITEESGDHEIAEDVRAAIAKVYGG